MKIQPVASPSAIQTQQTSNNSSARDRAMAILSGNSQASQAQAPNPVVQNQNAISPEEMGAITTPETSLESRGETNPRQEVSSEDTTSDTATETPKQPEDTPESRRFAQLARQEKQFRLRQQQFKQQEEAFKARQAEMEAKWTKTQEVDTTQYISKDRFRQDPLTVLAEAGLTYEQITEQLLNQAPRDPRMESTISELRNEIKALQQQNEEAKKHAADSQTQQYQAALRQIETDVKALVSNDPNFETIKETHSIKDVVDLIEQTYIKDGILLTNEEAAQMVEDYLVEEATKLTKISKIRAKIAQSNASKPQPVTAKTPVTQPQTNKQPQPMKTLTNAASASRPLTARERAIAAMEGKLK